VSSPKPVSSLKGVRVLAADDNDELLFALKELLESEGCEVVSAADGAEALALAKSESVDIILLDVMMPRMTGLEVLSGLPRSVLDSTPVLLLSSRDEASDIRVGIERGATDYVSKPYRREDLVLRMELALETRARRAEPDWTVFRNLGLHGNSPAMRQLLLHIQQVAVAEMPALILGETGAGKELVAKALHHLSSRGSRTLVTVNCSNFSSSLLTSELFGHVRGAFTGADTAKAGLFEAAHRSTLFLDEIGELDLELQARLLRVLQDGTFLPVGSTKEQQVDVRIIAATHRNLQEMVKAGTFREDLLFRIRVAELRIPALRERLTDLELLANHFVSELSAEGSAPLLSAEALKLLAAHVWPGNVRELRSEISRMLMKAKGQRVLSPAHVSMELFEQSPPSGDSQPIDTSLPLSTALEQVERQYIEKILSQTKGNKSQAAKILGMSRSSLIAKVRQYDIED
jgi:DNA-binding NtrC family response regulator